MHFLTYHDAGVGFRDNTSMNKVTKLHTVVEQPSWLKVK